MAHSPAPELISYTTWHADGCYHARFKTRLPKAALDAGCLQEITAPTIGEFAVAAMRNRIRIATWLVGRWADIQLAKERRERP